MESPPKKHKKHKKHKHHKKRREGEDEDGSVMVVNQSLEQEMVDITGGSPPPAIKLKIKIGAKSAPIGMKSKAPTPIKLAPAVPAAPTALPIPADMAVVESEDSPGLTDPNRVFADAMDTFMTKKPGEDTSDEEREWLDALESGTLDDNGEVKKEVDESLLTTRQKALLHGRAEDSLLELPSGYKTTELTEQQLQQRQQRAKKRREQAQEKREKDKKQTLDRLLKKQDSKFKTGRSKGTRRTSAPSVRYLNTTSKISISVPPNFPFPLVSQVAPKIPDITICGVSGCENRKKYSCSKTGTPLCSLQCYKKNLESHQIGTKIQVGT